MVLGGRFRNDPDIPQALLRMHRQSREYLELLLTSNHARFCVRYPLFLPWFFRFLLKIELRVPQDQFEWAIRPERAERFCRTPSQRLVVRDLQRPFQRLCTCLFSAMPAVGVEF